MIPPKAQRMKKIKKSNQKSIKLFDDQVLNLKFDEGQNSEKKNQIKVKCKEVSSSKKVKQFQKKKRNKEKRKKGLDICSSITLLSEVNFAVHCQNVFKLIWSLWCLLRWEKKNRKWTKKSHFLPLSSITAAHCSLHSQSQAKRSKKTKTNQNNNCVSKQKRTMNIWGYT